VKTFLLALLVLGVYALHQDLWNWHQARPFLFGFVPVGLAYHAAYSGAAALVMWTLVRFAWPAHLEESQPENQPAAGPTGVEVKR
jgi:hypothetical protein